MLCFSDKLIEQAVGGTVVSDIFKLHGESFFRNNEVRKPAFVAFVFLLCLSASQYLISCILNASNKGKMNSFS